MKNGNKFILTASVLLLSVVSYAQVYKADVPVTKQEQDQWCWAADSKCILDYYGFPQTQCSIVDYARITKGGTYFGSNNCCPKTTSCNKPNEIDYDYGIKGMLDHFGKIQSTVVQGPITIANVMAELKAEKPFVLGIMWTAGGGHVVVGCAYNQATGSITMMDSWQNNGMTTKKYSGTASISTNSGAGKIQEHLVLKTLPPLSVNHTGDLENAISIYPNPSSIASGITVNSKIALKAINVFNSMGQLVYANFSVTDNIFSINIPVEGLYTVQMITEKRIVNKKIIVQ